MANLAEAVDAAETDWLVSADIPDTVDYLTVESEVVQVSATFPAQYQARDGSTSDPRIRVVRAAGGTTAASHADATALTPLIPPSAGGGAAEAGTVVVTPPLEVDVAAALEAADTPGAGNPLMTQSACDLGTVLASGNDAGDQAIIGLADPTDPQDAATKAYVDGEGVPTLAAVLTAGNDMAVSGPGEIVAKDAGVIRASMAVTSGFAALSVRDITEVEVSSILLGVDAVMISVDEGTADMHITTGAVYLHTAGGEIVVGLDGTITLDLGAVGELRILGLPTADPVSAGAVWNDAGTLKISL